MRACCENDLNPSIQLLGRRLASTFAKVRKEKKNVRLALPNNKEMDPQIYELDKKYLFIL